MICEKCGSFLPDDALTCDHCGAYLGGRAGQNRDKGVAAIRQGRAGSQPPPAAPGREGNTREYGDYDMSPLPLENANPAPRRKAAPYMTERLLKTGASRPTARTGVPVRGNPHTPGTRRRAETHNPMRRKAVNWMLIGLVLVVLALAGGAGYLVYMSQSETGQQATARKNVLAAGEIQFALAASKDATQLTLREELLKEWNKAPAYSYWAVARQYVDVGDLESAMSAYRIADLLDPENYDGLMEMASTYELRSENDQAEAIYLRLIEDVSPFRGEAYTSLIRLYQNNDRGPEAADLMKLAYENTDREAFRLQRREYIPQSPQVNLTAGRYEISAMKQDILLTSPQSFDIYYTMDAEAKLPEGGILSDGGPLQIAEGAVTLRAVCVNGSLVSDPMSVSYTFYYPSPPAPKCNLAPNTYNSLQTVSLRAGTREEYTRKQQAEMEKHLTYYYTIDGSTPTKESPVYDGTPIQLPAGSVKLKAVCVNQYDKMSGVLEVGYKFNVKPFPPEPYNDGDLFDGFQLNKTSQIDFEQTFGKAKSVQDTKYLFLEEEARHLEYDWGYAVFALLNNQWQLVRIEMNSGIAAPPRGVGLGSTESEVCAAYKDFGQLQSPNGTRGLYYNYPAVGQVLIDPSGSRYVQYTCQTKESNAWVLQYWLRDGQVYRIVNSYQP